MVNQGERDILQDYYSIHNTHDMHCYICKQIYTPTKKDISTKNPNKYYKACAQCRFKKNEYFKTYRLKNPREST